MQLNKTLFTMAMIAIGAVAVPVNNGMFSATNSAGS